jgi:hypothetical protein
VDHVNFISNTKVFDSVFQNSQARDAGGEKHSKEGRMQRLLSPTPKLKNGNKKVLGAGEPDPICNRISKSQFLKEVVY